MSDRVHRIPFQGIRRPFQGEREFVSDLFTGRTGDSLEDSRPHVSTTPVLFDRVFPPFFSRPRAQGFSEDLDTLSGLDFTRVDSEEYTLIRVRINKLVNMKPTMNVGFRKRGLKTQDF